jgi:trk system potassium uptake protein TrkA
MRAVRVIIVGCGRVGSHLANTLSAERHEVVVIDKSPTSFSRLAREFTGRMLTGVGFDREILQKADIESANALAATTDSDNVNIVVAVTAKETFKVPHVVARIYNPQAAEIYRREGIPTVTPTLWAANTMKTILITTSLSALATLGSGEVESVCLEIPKNLAGRTVGDLAKPGEIAVGALVRRGQATIPTAETSLEIGDQLHITAVASALSRIEKFIAH